MCTHPDYKAADLNHLNPSDLLAHPAVLICPAHVQSECSGCGKRASCTENLGSQERRKINCSPRRLVTMAKVAPCVDFLDYTPPDPISLLDSNLRSWNSSMPMTAASRPHLGEGRETTAYIGGQGSGI